MSDNSSKKKSKRPTLKQRRKDKSAEIWNVLNTLQPELVRVKEKLKQADLLKSVADGLYEEMDKLAKKAPVDQATDLVVIHVNDVINEARELAAGDAYVQRIHAFVAAGDNPEHRDVVLVLRQLRQGLDRCHRELDSRVDTLTGHIATAEGLTVALDLYTDGDVIRPSPNDLSANDVSLSEKWLNGTFSNRHVVLERIDDLDIKSYFAADS